MGNVIRREYEIRISGHFLSALVNGEVCYLDQQDKESLTKFLAQFDGSIDVCLNNEDESESFFDRCDVCHLMSDVYECTVIETIKSEEK